MRKLFVILAGALLLTSTSAQAAEEYGWRFAAVTTDIFIARPFTFIATILGGAIWTVALPVTAPTRTSAEAFDALVRQPWQLTVDRELGEYDEL
jgi:hypothetical protein